LLLWVVLHRLPGCWFFARIPDPRRFPPSPHSSDLSSSYTHSWNPTPPLPPSGLAREIAASRLSWTAGHLQVPTILSQFPSSLNRAVGLLETLPFKIMNPFAPNTLPRFVEPVGPINTPRGHESIVNSEEGNTVQTASASSSNFSQRDINAFLALLAPPAPVALPTRIEVAPMDFDDPTTQPTTVPTIVPTTAVIFPVPNRCTVAQRHAKWTPRKIQRFLDRNPNFRCLTLSQQSRYFDADYGLRSEQTPVQYWVYMSTQEWSQCQARRSTGVGQEGHRVDEDEQGESVGSQDTRSGLSMYIIL